ncbi:MAG: COX15/CtaA family protein [Verrucomicrobiota bacterium]
MREKDRGLISNWLLIVAGAIALMMVIGAITRLTESGLSMTEWNLIGGFPPLHQSDWEILFEKYQGTPQHLITFPDMNLEAFKRIFWWEYIHRMFGRGLGLLFGLPFLFLILTKRVNAKWIGLLSIALVLGGMQGFLGWYMVQSGLVERPWVSPVRLTAHLMMALTLFSYTLGMALWIRFEPKESPISLSASRPWLVALTLVILAQLILGGSMSGMKAAISYPTYPDMNGVWIPEMLWKVELGFLNFFENATFVQFLHRSVALVVAGLSGYLVWKHIRESDPRIKTLSYGLASAVGLQFLIGVLTVINAKGEVPEVLGVAHQVGAIIVVSVVVCWWVLMQKGKIGNEKETLA